MRILAPILLAVLLFLPSQANTGPRISPWPAPYAKLGLIYDDCLELSKMHRVENERFSNLLNDARERDLPLRARLVLVRAWVLHADQTHAQATYLARRFDREYRRNPPCRSYLSDFDSQFRGMRQIRGRVRMAVYREVICHRWSWEWEDLDFNGHCFEFVAARCGFADDHELFMRTIGEVEAALSDVMNCTKAQWSNVRLPTEPASEPDPKPKQAKDGKTPRVPAKP